MDYPALEKVSEMVIEERQKFGRLVVPKGTLLEIFAYSKYTNQLIESKIPDGTSTTVYRCGPMVDLCVGPHIPHTGKIKAFMVTKQLKTALEKQYPGKWEINPGDGAFYSPKIDITIRDALRRSFQCATIQLDFQLPERFNLKYRPAEESQNQEKPPSRPVIIHRAILGSLERFIAIITGHHVCWKMVAAFVL
ncbi:hypothetical protein EW026_g7145 [Hermanssonia centrifuga]|uniref:Threonyl-tRNA synthetase n=1 Tax=Hermanssonia centrifuga TaxID=98765 RepID=A0A4S4K8Z5_9APHY|nr:hypothetical protein EW026_g7145 [Hermanssonia centrifuga]